MGRRMKSEKGTTSRAASFRHAFAGIWSLLYTEPNARLHALATALVLALGVWLDIGIIQWALIAFAIGLVWTTEACNTALEAIGNVASPEYHPLTGRAKDLSAAAVLISALTAACVGVLVLGPPLWARLFGR
jgi:diacylglycerol kinase